MELEFIEFGSKPMQDIMTNEVSWQSLIYDLVRSEELNPWDIDIVLLTQSLLKKIRKIEEANLFASSKLFLVSSILVRMKSEILYNKLMSLDKKDTKIEEPEISEEINLPLLIPKTPLTRQKRVTLHELMNALNEAIRTEERRTKKRRIIKEQEEHIVSIIPRIKVNLKDKINEIYKKIRQLFNKKNIQKLVFDDLVGVDNKEEKILTFIPLLHLDYQRKIELLQQKTFGDIEIKMYKD